MPGQRGENLQNSNSQEMLRSCQAELRAIFDLSPVGMVQVSATTGKFVRVNARYCEWTGYSSDELLALTPADITHPDDLAADNEVHQRLLRGEISSQDRKKRYLRHDGTVVWVHASATLLRDAYGQPDRTMAVIQDITQRKADEQALEVDADLTRLAQVFQNLSNNAAKYSESGGQIHLSVENQGTHATVTIKDAGVGIAADQLPHIFEMFTQVDRSLDMSQGGLGIGLSLVKQLVGMHGGTVEAKSGGPGHGSAFVVTLPLIDQTLERHVPGGDEKAAASPLPLKILVVDDNRDGADSLSEMLQLMGNDTRTGYDGEQAVAMAADYRPDVILLDIGLPKLNGYEACRAIRQQAWSQGMVLIAVTGWGQDKDRSRTREAGFDHHMVKPLDPQELMKILHGLNLAHEEGLS